MAHKPNRLRPVEVPYRDAVAASRFRSARLEDHESAARLVEDYLVEPQLLVGSQVRECGHLLSAEQAGALRGRDAHLLDTLALAPIPDQQPGQGPVVLIRLVAVEIYRD